jgi:hypothetical protein
MTPSLAGTYIYSIDILTFGPIGLSSFPHFDFQFGVDVFDTTRQV